MIIGLAGYARVGKDTSALALINNGFIRYAFADELKADLDKLIFSNTGKHLSDIQKDISRPLMVEWGRFMRKMEPLYWVRRLFEKIESDGNKDKDIVITDVRYQNEVDFVSNLNGYVIRVNRKDYGPANDEEEQSFRDMKTDFTINNNDTIEQLHRDMSILVFDLIGGKLDWMCENEVGYEGVHLEV